MNYIFGYGSLICPKSRARTGFSSKAYPIEVQGIRRNWAVQPPDWPATAVGAIKDDSALCNGVYFQVDDQSLLQFDEREKGYERIELNWHMAKGLCNQPLPKTGKLWVYVGFENNKPTNERPIVLSYVDVILNGCLSYNESFAKRFIELTGHWQHLKNDRDNPIYLRAASHQNAQIIDELLSVVGQK